MKTILLIITIIFIFNPIHAAEIDDGLDGLCYVLKTENDNVWQKHIGKEIYLGYGEQYGRWKNACDTYFRLSQFIPPNTIIFTYMPNENCTLLNRAQVALVVEPEIFNKAITFEEIIGISIYHWRGVWQSEDRIFRLLGVKTVQTAAGINVKIPYIEFVQ